jgi:hypothetical protein
LVSDRRINPTDRRLLVFQLLEGLSSAFAMARKSCHAMRL